MNSRTTHEQEAQTTQTERDARRKWKTQEPVYFVNILLC